MLKHQSNLGIVNVKVEHLIFFIVATFCTENNITPRMEMETEKRITRIIQNIWIEIFLYFSSGAIRRRKYWLLLEHNKFGQNWSHRKKIAQNTFDRVSLLKYFPGVMLTYHIPYVNQFTDIWQQPDAIHYALWDSEVMQISCRNIVTVFYEYLEGTFGRHIVVKPFQCKMLTTSFRNSGLCKMICFAKLKYSGYWSLGDDA